MLPEERLHPVAAGLPEGEGMRYWNRWWIVMGCAVIAWAPGSAAQEAAAPPPRLVHTVAGEANLVRAVLLLDGLPRCDALAARIVENTVSAGRIAVALDLVAPGDCPRSEGSLRVDLTGVPAGEYAVGLVVRDASGPQAETLARVDAARIAVPGDPGPEAAWTLMVAREGRLDSWVEVSIEEGPPKAPEAPELEQDGPGRPSQPGFQTR